MSLTYCLQFLIIRCSNQEAWLAVRVRLSRPVWQCRFQSSIPCCLPFIRLALMLPWLLGEPESMAAVVPGVSVWIRNLGSSFPLRLQGFVNYPPFGAQNLPLQMRCQFPPLSVPALFSKVLRAVTSLSFPKELWHRVWQNDHSTQRCLPGGLLCFPNRW